MADFRQTHWYVRGGPKNGGHFGYFENGRMKIGRNHLPATKNSRTRMMRLRWQELRRLGCRG